MFSFPLKENREVCEKWAGTHFARPCQLFCENSDKVYRIRRIQEHLVDYERSEIIYLVIRDSIPEPHLNDVLPLPQPLTP